jgi:hypothetical protein
MTSAIQVLRLLKVDAQIAPEPLVRAMMLVYLVDWKAALDLSRVLTDARWRRANWGPYSAEVLHAIPGIRYTKHDEPIDGYRGGIDLAGLNVVADVRAKYGTASSEEIAKLVFSTYQMIYSSPEDYIDLPAMAEIYRRDFQKARDRAIA